MKLALGLLLWLFQVPHSHQGAGISVFHLQWRFPAVAGSRMPGTAVPSVQVPAASLAVGAVRGLTTPPARPSSTRLSRLPGPQGPVELIRRSGEMCVRAASASAGQFCPALAQAWQSSPLRESPNLLGGDCRRCRELPGVGLRSAPPTAAGNAALLALRLGCL